MDKVPNLFNAWLGVIIARARVAGVALESEEGAGKQRAEKYQ